MSDYTLFFDGSCGPTNPGPQAGYGVTIQREGKTFYEESGKLSGETYTNNYAEFHALVVGLEYLLDTIEPSDRLFIRGDSMLVVNVMNGKWSGSAKGVYFPAFVRAKDALTAIRAKNVKVDISWVPRELNRIADGLSTEYLK